MKPPALLARTTLWLPLPLALACAPTPGTKSAAPSAEDAASEAASAPAVDDAVGGRLFDKWYTDRSFTGDFKPDDKATPEPDGVGGPSGDGTLNDGGGKPMVNTGHDYRLKNLFGWDLRGTEGIYGAAYHNKSTALPVNLLTDTRTEEELTAWLAAGDEKVPALGDVLDKRQLAATARFILAVRTKRLPHPDQIWTLSKDAPNHYTLVEGGDAAIGASLVREHCAGCHGADGTKIAIEGDHSLGAYSRMKAYEAWIKIVNGQPGTAMGRQIADAAELLSIFAALCDRAAFPPTDPAHDVPDGDPRCGAYLK